MEKDNSEHDEEDVTEQEPKLEYKKKSVAKKIKKIYLQKTA